MKTAEQRAEDHTNKLIKQINKGQQGKYIHVKSGNFMMELDEDDIFAHFMIQPKSDDSPEDLTIITKHNKKILSVLREKGFDITRFVVTPSEENEFEMLYAI